jgi:hypothetical protein
MGQGNRFLVGLVGLFAVLGAATVALAAGRTENYRYEPNSRDVATARAVLPTRREVLGIDPHGGLIRPDHTPETAPGDLCDGRFQKEHDLVITGDAAARFTETQVGLLFDLQANVFKTEQMAATDLERTIAFGTGACVASLFLHQGPPVTVTRFRRLTLPALKGIPSFTVQFNLTGGKSSPGVTWVLSGFVRGRTEVAVSTVIQRQLGFEAASNENGVVYTTLHKLAAHPSG